VHCEDGRELYGIIATEGISLRKLYGLRNQARCDVDLTILMREIVGKIRQRCGGICGG
jgi:hypothetical protein